MLIYFVFVIFYFFLKEGPQNSGPTKSGSAPGEDPSNCSVGITSNTTPCCDPDPPTGWRTKCHKILSSH